MSSDSTTRDLDNVTQYALRQHANTTTHLHIQTENNGAFN